MGIVVASVQWRYSRSEEACLVYQLLGFSHLFYDSARISDLLDYKLIVAWILTLS